MVARRAHNPKVIGSNPVPATNKIKGLEGTTSKPFLVLIPHCYLTKKAALNKEDGLLFLRSYFFLQCLFIPQGFLSD